MSQEAGFNSIAEAPLERPALFTMPSLERVWALLRERDLRLPAVVLAVHVLVVGVVAALAMRYAVALPEVRTAGYRLPPLHGWEHYVVQPLRNWDGFWYGLIAEQGYGYSKSSTAFWPLYPLAMAAVHQVVPIPVEFAGLALSNLAFFAALVVLRRLVRAEAGEDVARRTLWLVALSPAGFFFSAAYTESFFLLFTALTFWWARQGRWRASGIAGCLSALTRNAGGALTLPLAMMLAARYGRDPRRWPRESVAIVLPAIGSLAYLAYLWYVWGNALLTFDIQKNWGRSPAPPWRAFTMAREQIRFDWLSMLLHAPGWTTLTSFQFRWSFAESEVLDVATTIVIVPLLVYAFRRLPAAWGVWCAIVVAIPLFGPSMTHPLMSMPRYVAVLFPLSVAAALLLRSRPVYYATLAASTLLLCGLTVQFVTWFWVA